MAKQETITFNNAPSFYVAYMENWLAHQKKAKANPTEIAIVEDIKKLVEIGVAQLKPASGEPEKK